jgi:hypothetical protein
MLPPQMTLLPFLSLSNYASVYVAIIQQRSIEIKKIKD